MPIKATWIVPKRLFVYYNYGITTRDELENGMVLIQQYLNEGEAPIHVIIDMRQSVEVPKEIAYLRKLINVYKHAQMGWVITLSQNSLVNFINNILSNFIHIHYESCKTEQEAYAFLEKVEPSLAKLPPYPQLEEIS